MEKKAVDDDKSAAPKISEDLAKVSKPVEPTLEEVKRREAVRLQVEKAKADVERVQALKETGATLTTTDTLKLVVAGQEAINEDNRKKLDGHETILQRLLEMSMKLVSSVEILTADRRAAMDSNSRELIKEQDLIREQDRRVAERLEQREREILQQEAERQADEDFAAVSRKRALDLERRQLGAKAKQAVDAKARAASPTTSRDDETAAPGLLHNLLVTDDEEEDSVLDLSGNKMTMDSFQESTIFSRTKVRERRSQLKAQRESKEQRNRAQEWSEEEEADFIDNNSRLMERESREEKGRSRSVDGQRRSSIRSSSPEGRDRGGPMKFADRRDTEEQFNFGVESAKREQQKTRRDSQSGKGSKDKTALFGESTFGSMHDSVLLRKYMDMAKVNAAIQARNRPAGVLLVPKEISLPIMQRMNMFTHIGRVAKCIEFDSAVENTPCKPGKFVSEQALKLAVLRIAHLSRRVNLLRDLGIAGIVVPTVELLKSMNKEEYHYNLCLSMIPYDGVEAEESFLSCFRSQEKSLGFYEGEELGPLDADRLEDLIDRKFELTRGLLRDVYPQWAKRPDEEGNLKHMSNFSGIFYNKEQPMNEGMNKVFYSGIAFAPPRLGEDGKPDKKHRTMARAIALDMSKTFVPSKDIKRLGFDWAHDLGLAFQCFEDFNDNRKSKSSFDGVWDQTTEISSVPMMHQDVARHKQHPGRLELKPVRDGRAPLQQSANQPAQLALKRSLPFGHKGAVSHDKLEEAWQQLGAQARGEEPKNPSFWTNRRGDVRSLPKKLERQGMLHMLAEERRVARQVQADEDDWMLDQADNEDDGYDTAPDGPDGENVSDDGEEEYDDEDNRLDTRPYYEDARDDVMHRLANMEKSVLKQMPPPVQERVNEFRADRDAREREQQRNRDSSYRNDAPQWQRDRNSANNNPGRLQDGKRVAFAPGGFAKGACIRHQRGACEHADNPHLCKWSHDPDVCDADADVVAQVAATRKAARQKTRKPADKAAVVANIGANNRQPTEQKQSSEVHRNSHSKADNDKEE